MTDSSDLPWTNTVSLDQLEVIEALAYRAIVKAGLAEDASYHVYVRLNVETKTGEGAAVVRLREETAPMEGFNGDRS